MSLEIDTMKNGRDKWADSDNIIALITGTFYGMDFKSSVNIRC